MLLMLVGKDLVVMSALSPKTSRGIEVVLCSITRDADTVWARNRVKFSWVIVALWQGHLLTPLEV